MQRLGDEKSYFDDPKQITKDSSADCRRLHAVKLSPESGRRTEKVGQDHMQSGG